MAPKKIVYKNKWFSVEDESGFFRIQAGSGAAVLAVTKDKKIVLVRQYRQAIREARLEIPTGAIDPGESPAQAAARELYEETGYRAKRLISLIKGMPLMANRVNARTDLFFAPGVVLDVGFVVQEPIEVKLISIDVFKKMVLQGKFLHASGIIAFQLATWKKLIK